MIKNLYFYFFLEHFFEQYNTFAQSFCHFFLQLKGFLQLLQVLVGKLDFL